MSYWQIDPKALLIRAEELDMRYLGEEIALPLEGMTVIGKLKKLSLKHGPSQDGEPRLQVKLTVGTIKHQLDGKDLVQITSLASKLPY